MKFKYSARNQAGELQAGFVESPDRDAASAVLTSHSLYVLSLESTETKRWSDNFLSFFRRVKKSDLMIFTRQFAVLLQAKISLGDSLKNLYRQTKNTVLKETIFEISSDIDAGLSLSQSLERHGAVFSSFFISMVRSAEITGRMEEVMGFMADFLEKESTLISKIRNALIYPAVVIVLFIVVAAIMVGYVFPQLKPVFIESNTSLPLITTLLLNTGSLVADWWLAIVIFLGVVIFAVFDYFRTIEGKIVFDSIAVRMPVFGELFRKVYVARFAESTSVLIKGGIPVAQALEIAGHTVGSISYRDTVHDIAEAVRQGQLMSQALELRENFFPPLVAQMVAVGESTGKLDELLDRVSIFYTREVDDTISNLVELIQPTIMIVIAVFVGLLFAAVLLPIYSLVQTF